MISLQKIDLGQQGMSVVFLVYLEMSLMMDVTQYAGKNSFRFVIQMSTLVPFNVVHSQELVHVIATILTGRQISMSTVPWNLIDMMLYLIT